MDEPEPTRRRAKPQNPMEEENFPSHSPTRDAVEREMREPGNVRGPTRPTPEKRPPLKEAGDGMAGDADVSEDAASGSGRDA